MELGCGATEGCHCGSEDGEKTEKGKARKAINAVLAAHRYTSDRDRALVSLNPVVLAASIQGPT